MEWDDQYWDNLLIDIEDGLIIPVIGRDVLTVQYQNREVSLYPLLAEKLAERLKVSGEDLPEGGELNAVVGRYLEAHDSYQLERVYRRLPRIIESLELPVPEFLEKLAEIRHFKLFLTTTFDSLLTEALQKARGAQPDTIVYDPDADLNKADLPAPLEAMDNAVVFHLFGKVSASQVYAITQEDILEFLHKLQSQSRRPQLLFDALSQKSLLIIGCNFGGWLARFFLRTTRRERLLNGSPNYLADSRVTEDSNLVRFLKLFSPGTVVYEKTTEEFIDELHTRWIKKFGTEAIKTPVKEETAVRPQLTREEEPHVFLSYASEDREAAQKFNKALSDKHIPVFFDRDDLQGGDDWDRKLKNSIEACWLFVPLVSKSTLTPELRYFRKEWSLAEELAQMASRDLAFVVPVVIDDTPPEEKGLAAYKILSQQQWIECRQGGPTEDFVARITNLYREHQKARNGYG